MLTHVGVFSVDFSRIDTGKTVCFLVPGGPCAGGFALYGTPAYISPAIAAPA